MEFERNSLLLIKLLKPAQTVIAQHFNEQLSLVNDVLQKQKLFSVLENQPMILLHNNFYHNHDNAMQNMIMDLGWEILLQVFSKLVTFRQSLATLPI